MPFKFDGYFEKPSSFYIDFITDGIEYEYSFTITRDQILFTNKKEYGSTEVYSLFDFKDFRENMDAEKCYLQGRFDAVPYINSSISVIKNLLGESFSHASTTKQQGFY